MIEEIKGNLLDSKANHFVHCCNCFCNFGGGIASQIRRFYPSAYEADLKTSYGNSLKLGTFSYATQRGKHVYNLYAQYRFGGEGKVYFIYSAFDEGLKKIKTFIENNFDCKDVVFGLPKYIGCGLAGGSWEETLPIIEKNLENAKFRTVIVGFDNETA
jgi:O-acetyl-ADP-ribose deacetylase (regulator of RNase III)